MKGLIFLASLLSASCFAELPPVEGELGPEPTSVPIPKMPRAKPTATPDGTYAHWRFKFVAASDKLLGSPRDLAAIRSDLPITDPTIRWASPFLAIAGGDNRLYVIEKRHSKWEITHRFERRFPPPPAIRY